MPWAAHYMVIGVGYLLAELWESQALVGERWVVHNVPVKHIELVVSHDILERNRNKDEHALVPSERAPNLPEKGDKVLMLQKDKESKVLKCSPGSKRDSDTSLQTHQHHKELQRASSASAHNKIHVLPITEPMVETWKFNSAWEEHRMTTHLHLTWLGRSQCFPLPQKQPSLEK